MIEGKTCEMTIGDWDVQLNIVYVPHYDRFDDWRRGVWNPMVLCDVDIESILATFEHVNNSLVSTRWIDYDELKGVKQETIMEFIRGAEER